MKKLEELADTTTTEVDAVIPEIWSDEVEAAAQARRVARNFVKVNEDLKNGPGDIVHIPKTGKINAVALTEGTDITPTALEYSTLDLTPAPVGAGVRVTREAVEEARLDILRDATEQLGEALAQKEDQDILEALAGATGAVLYGGAKSSSAELVLGDVLTTDLIASGVTEVRSDNYNPDVIFIAPEQERALLKDSQFVDASKYGANEVVQNGEIGKYLGMKVIVTTNLPKVTDGAAGHKCLIFDSKHAGAIAIKRDATIDTDYEVLKRSHLLVGTMKYDAGRLNDSAICVLVVSDA